MSNGAEDPQRDMFDDLHVRRPAKDDADPTEQAAREYLERNPEVWRLIVGYTFELIKRGRANYGMKAVIERIRWHRAVSNPDDDFKINNNYAPVWARMFAAAYPEHAAFFRTRVRESDR